MDIIFRIVDLKTVLQLWNVFVNERNFGMTPAALKKCSAGHVMTVDNTYWHRQHGHVYPQCRECIKAARKNGYRYTVADQRQLAKTEIIKEDISQITACPKCKGILRWSNDSRLEDEVACLYCGWRPSAKMEQEL